MVESPQDSGASVWRNRASLYSLQCSQNANRMMEASVFCSLMVRRDKSVFGSKDKGCLRVVISSNMEVRFSAFVGAEMQIWQRF